MALSGRCCLALFLVLCSASLVVAEEGTGRLEGRVIKDGEGVGAVIVFILELAEAETTDEKGEFAFDKVPQGNYNVILTLGENTLTRENVYVTANKTRELELEVDWDLGIYEKVTVTAAARAAKIVDAPAAVTSIPEEPTARSTAGSRPTSTAGTSASCCWGPRNGRRSPAVWTTSQIWSSFAGPVPRCTEPMPRAV